ncbi:preprotein translocase subunit SecA [Parahalioglobus pacificus]|uniref:Protein translocase subunit SecA n=1 Tax=Parahalioglobus pacificus TaxID=930806 RepID=A0A918XC98_9GAMM|nr:preprotein translocase subunit SecA [Halioglobus pacificus]GHD26015.1 protein translocase subunit SecA [Halioglobus pacificus]
MITNALKKIFGTRNDRELKRMSKVVKQINALEEGLQALSDDELKAKTQVFRDRVAGGESLDKLLPEAFAVVREAGKRTMGMRHFDVQLIGGMALHEGKIAEMRTGEGKTLVATLPAYLNALTGNSVHLVTVNDYLAGRDANWMSPLYNFLGMTVGVITSGQAQQQKREAYSANIIYGTNNEFGFDYLRDNMAFSLQDKMQGDLAFAIVDEVDSILIDEARTPLIISGASEDSSELYKAINKLIPGLRVDSEGQEGHYTVDEKQRQIELTEQGHEHIEELLVKEKLLEEGDSLYASTNLSLLHHVYSGLRAHVLFNRDVEYIVQDGQVVLIDEHTGRTMPGRRLSEGLHQAIEAKEGVAIQSESQTMASTTFQNYFRIYGKLSGMTGTADTEAFEFRQIYGLDVLVIPTNKDMLRQDLNDLVYLTREEKFDAIVEDVRECIKAGAPVLVGTASVETSEELSQRFRQSKIDHKVLNAKYHEQEAEIIAQAGRPGVVTIATNMAGRGTDIVLGGNLEAELKAMGDVSQERKESVRKDWEQRQANVLEAGGLHILGTERHESRRIDNQLRGRSGRQGDPGVSRFYLSLEDNLMRIFASDRVKNFMQALGMEKGEAIEHRMVTNAIEKAQRKVEGRNFDIRKQLLEYDDVANDQRQIIYQQRNDLLTEADISETINAIRSDVVNEAIDSHIPPMSIEEQWDVPGLEKHLEAEFAVALPVQEWLDSDNSLHEEALRERIGAEVQSAYDAKAELVGPEMRRVEKQIMLQVLDTLWKEHLATMDHLRQGIHLRAYAQKNPKQEYKRESFALFEELLSSLKYEVVKFLSHVQVQRPDEAALIEQRRREEAEKEKLAFEHAQASAVAEEKAEPETDAAAQPFTRQQPKVGRNEPCPCGSGKKYKQCCGALQ